MKNCFKKNYTASQQINDNTCAIEQIATSLDNLQTQIDTEKSTRASADDNLQQQITSEISARQSADQNLQQQINEIETGTGGDMKSTDYPNLVELENKLDMTSGGGYGLSYVDGNAEGKVIVNSGYAKIIARGANSGANPQDQINLSLLSGNTPSNTPNRAYLRYGESLNNVRDMLKPLNDYLNISANSITPVVNGGYMIDGQASRRLDAVVGDFETQWERTPSTYILPLKSGNNVSFNVVEGNDGQLLEISSTGGSGGLDATTQLIVDLNPTYTHIDSELVVQYTARFRTGTQPPFTFSNDFILTLPINITGTDGVVVDVAESGNAIEVHAERQKVTTTFANLFTELNNLSTQTKTIKSISFSPSKDISVNTNNFKLSSSGITTETSTDIAFLSGQSYVLYPTQLPDPNNASYIFNLQGTGVRCGTMSIAMNSTQIQSTRFYLPTTDNLNILFAGTQTITTQISTESVVIEYE